jgi:drug/metabolite transporter (DMT)-like permease
MEEATMKQNDERQRFLDKPENVGRLLWAFTVLCVLVLLADFFFHRHTYHPLEEMWGFYGVFGFLGIVGLVQAAKGLRKLMGRNEEYYGPE